MDLARNLRNVSWGSPFVPMPAIVSVRYRAMSRIIAFLNQIKGLILNHQVQNICSYGLENEQIVLKNSEIHTGGMQTGD